MGKFRYMYLVPSPYSNLTLTEVLNLLELIEPSVRANKVLRWAAILSAGLTKLIRMHNNNVKIISI